MGFTGWMQLILFMGLLGLITKPMGIHLYKVLEGKGKNILSPVFGRLEDLLYKAIGIDRNQEQDWKEYGLALGIFSLIGLFLTYFVLRFQHHLPLNPQHFPAVSEHLAFNTAASFTTNTNWQSYAGETTMSHFSQMAGLVFQNFVSAAVGIAVAAALVQRDRPEDRKNDREFLGGPDPRYPVYPFAVFAVDRRFLCFPGRDSEF